MRFASLGSGSRGNGTLVEYRETCVLLDCGFRLKEVEARLARLGKRPEQLAAVLVTHEHSDHIGGVGALARKYRLPVWMTRGSALAERHGKLPSLNIIEGYSTFSVGDLKIDPFPVPHDAREPCQFVFTGGNCRLGILTDLGTVTDHVTEMLTSCDGLLLECNHDEEMLRRGRYPAALKRRVGGALGHLSNRQAAELLASLERCRIQHLVATHLSQENNRPEQVIQCLAQASGWQPEDIRIADQELGFDWLSLTGN